MLETTADIVPTSGVITGKRVGWVYDSGMNPSLQKFAIPGSRRPSIPEAKLLGRSNSAQRITLSIYARQNPHPPDATVRSLDALRTELPGKRRYLTTEQFNSVYGADPADLEKIAAWAKANQLDVLESSASKRRVQVQGSIQNIERAFSVELNEYQHPQDGQYRGREGEVHVPAELFGIIDGVFGLDTRRVGRPRRRRNTQRRVSMDSLKAEAAIHSPAHSFRLKWLNCTATPLTWTGPNRTSRYLHSTAQEARILAAATAWRR